MIELFLIRHGLTEGNKKKRYIGRTDEPLCPEGLEQLSALSYPVLDNIFISPMRRCVQTARILYPQARLHIIDDFRECDFGEFENRNYLELADNENYQKWIDSGGTLPFPGGESPKEFQRRTLLGFQRVVSCCIRGQCERAALVVHGGTIMNILEAYGLPEKSFYDWHVANGEGYRVLLDPYLWKKRKRSLHVIDRLCI